MSRRNNLRQIMYNLDPPIHTIPPGPIMTLVKKQMVEEAAAENFRTKLSLCVLVGLVIFCVVSLVASVGTAIVVGLLVAAGLWPCVEVR